MARALLLCFAAWRPYRPVSNMSLLTLIVSAVPASSLDA
jgi:hypothetical protein